MADIAYLSGNAPTSSAATVYESLVGFQWLFIIAVLCIKHRDNPNKRRYETATLLISRKNGKTFLIAVLFALLLIIEPKFSEFYSVAADGELSRLIKKELEQLLATSPLLEKHFKVLRTRVECLLTKYCCFRRNTEIRKTWFT